MLKISTQHLASMQLHLGNRGRNGCCIYNHLEPACLSSVLFNLRALFTLIIIILVVTFSAFLICGGRTVVVISAMMNSESFDKSSSGSTVIKF